MTSRHQHLNIGFLPLEILQEVAITLPSLRDVLAFSLVDRHIWSALATPVIHAGRVSSRGWDVDTWIEEYTMTDTHPGSVLTWRKIDFLHEELESLLDQHSSIPYPSPGPSSSQLIPKHLPEDVRIRTNTLKLVNSIIAVLRHNRLYNLNRLMHAKSNTALLSLFRPLADVTFAQSTSISVVDSLHLAGRFMWLVPDLSQRALFNSASFLCSAARKEFAIKSLLRETFKQWGTIPRWFQGLNSLPDVGVPNLTVVEYQAIHAKRSSICAAALVLLWSHLLYSPEFPKSTFPVRPPTLPLPIAGIHRDWLSPSSFPLSALRASETSWVGYYSTPMGSKLRITTPMTITLTKRTVLNTKTSDNVITFEGTGLDAIRSFRLTGTISKDGIVLATKKYDHGPRWNWNGMVLPWALVGIWGNKNSWGGWWWIWPVHDQV